MSVPSSAESSGRFVIGLLLGLVGTCLVGSVIGVPIGYGVAKGARKSPQNIGWNLKPIVVYAVDVEAGTVVTFDMISQRSIPQQFVDESMVPPDEASFLINQRLAASVRAGDPTRLLDLLGPGAEECIPRR